MSSEIDSDGNDVHETKEIITRRVQQKGLQKRIVPARRRAWIPPQNMVDKAWARFSVKIFSKATAVLPVTNPDHQHASPPPEQGQLVITNFEEAAKACRQKVEKIVKEHKRANQRYRDPHFDIYLDLMSRKGHCLGTLAKPTKWSVKNESKKLCPDGDLPKSVKRVDKIFDKDLKTFSPELASSDDIRQGKVGNCWLMASLTALATMPEMIARICVAKDEGRSQQIGVYGFLFYRDGEWISSIIDDNLYLSAADWDSQTEEGGPSVERYVLEKIELEDKEKEKEHLKLHQTGSRALWGGHCRNENETWLPLLEKAYAKAHGDYYSMDGGWPGEGLEDLTGGVTTELLTSDILNEDEFWNNDLKNVKKKFLFSCATGVLDTIHRMNWKREGIEELHAYTIMEAQEIDLEDKPASTKTRLLRLRNPWGTPKRGSWQGAWSDGSKEWTPQTLEKLNHKQGADSAFWISYEDFLRKFQVIDRTHLFLEPEWRLAQQWTSIDVPWRASYHETFQFTFKKPSAPLDSQVVIVLSQLDDRYFRGLEGQYFFKLYFRLHFSDKLGGDDYIARSHGNSVMFRSVVAELPELEEGTYSVVVKVVAERNTSVPSVEEMVEKMCRDNTGSYDEKFSQVGFSYNVAHSKGASLMEAQMKRKQGEERRKAWKRRHEVRKRAARKFKTKRRMIKTAPVVPGDPTVDKTQLIEKASDLKQPDPTVTTPAALGSSLATTVPSLRNMESVSRDATQSPGGMPSSTEIGKTTQHQATQTEVRPQNQNKEGPDQQEESVASSEYHTDTDSMNSFCPEEEYHRISYDPRYGSPNDNVDPWNAVCVVGLRVYSKDPNLRIEVIMPGQGEKPGLDVDDKQAGVPVEVPLDGSTGESPELPDDKPAGAPVEVPPDRGKGGSPELPDDKQAGMPVEVPLDGSKGESPELAV